MTSYMTYSWLELCPHTLFGLNWLVWWFWLQFYVMVVLEKLWPFLYCIWMLSLDPLSKTLNVVGGAGKPLLYAFQLLDLSQFLSYGRISTVVECACISIYMNPTKSTVYFGILLREPHLRYIAFTVSPISRSVICVYCYYGLTEFNEFWGLCVDY
jgi:hypothetical protein